MKEVRAGTDLHSSNPQHGRLYEPRYASYYRAKDMRLPASLQDRVSIFTKVLESLPHLETGILSLHTTRSIGADVRHSRHDSSFKSPAKRWYRNKNPFQFLWCDLPVVDRPTFPDKLEEGGVYQEVQGISLDIKKHLNCLQSTGSNSKLDDVVR